MTTATQPVKSARLSSAELPRDAMGLDILDRTLYRMTKHVVAAIGNSRGKSVCWQTMLGEWMAGEVIGLNVDGTVSIRRSVYGGECILHWSKVPALVEEWEREKEAAMFE